MNYVCLGLLLCATSKTKYIIVNVFNITTTVNEAKIMGKHISCDSKCSATSN